jgi:hypothetical protein
VSGETVDDIWIRWSKRKMDRRWRVWFRHVAGEETYLDVPAWNDTEAIRVACAHMRQRTDRMRGWWCDRWQRLCVPVGRWDWKRREFVIDPPSRKRRLRLWFRKQRRGPERSVSGVKALKKQRSRELRTR